VETGSAKEQNAVSLLTREEGWVEEGCCRRRQKALQRRVKLPEKKKGKEERKPRHFARKTTPTSLVEVLSGGEGEGEKRRAIKNNLGEREGLQTTPTKLRKPKSVGCGVKIREAEKMERRTLWMSVGKS